MLDPWVPQQVVIGLLLLSIGWQAAIWHNMGRLQGQLDILRQQRDRDDY